MKVIDMALEARLRPAANHALVGFCVLYAGLGFKAIQTKYDNAGGIRIADNGGISRILVDESGQRVKVRLIQNVEFIAVDRRNELNCLKEAALGGTGKDSDRVRGRVEC